MTLQHILEHTNFTPAAAHLRRDEIGRSLQQLSAHIDGENFDVISNHDLELLFDDYDQRLFDGGLRHAVGEKPLRFRLSKRMTRAGGTTTRFLNRRGSNDVRAYEIAISTTLLFQTFEDIERPVHVTGIRCPHRLAALQCVFEHELVHLAEMLTWWDSTCGGPRFQSIARRLFGHTDHRHALVTPRERARSQFGISPGSRVRFRFDGHHYEGVVNRITKRASVLVKDDRGRRYSDGHRYTCYYIPIDCLEAVR